MWWVDAMDDCWEYEKRLGGVDSTRTRLGHNDADADGGAGADCYDMLLGWKVEDHWLGHNSWQMMMLLAWTDLLTTPASP